MVAGRIQNLKPWPKGVSGNPGGRPKRDLSAEVAQAVFEQNPEAIYRAMLKALLKGSPKVFAVLADRAYGKVKQESEDEGLEGVAEKLAEIRKRKLERMSEAEINSEIKRLEGELGIKQIDGELFYKPQGVLSE